MKKFELSDKGLIVDSELNPKDYTFEKIVYNLFKSGKTCELEKIKKQKTHEERLKVALYYKEKFGI